MARIRSIHPGLFTDEAFVGLSADAQIFLLGLWTESDDQGMFEWKPITLRMRLRPTKDGPVEGLLDELSASLCIRKFDISGRSYGAIRNFRKFQRPKKPNAIHPMTDEIRTYVHLTGVSSELDLDEEDEVIPDKGSGGEKSDQMKDEGGRVKDVAKEVTTSGVASPTPSAGSPEFIRIPTNRFETVGEEVVISEHFVEEYQRIYPAVAVRDQLRAMRGWSLANMETRKTRKGMTRFINAWLGRQQNSGVSRETAYGGRNGGTGNNQSFGSSVARQVRARNSEVLFGDGSLEIVVSAGPADQAGDRDESPRLGHTVDAA